MSDNENPPRAPGFYWIQDPDGTPEPAQCDGERWILLGMEGAPDDEPSC